MNFLRLRKTRERPTVFTLGHTYYTEPHQFKKLTCPDVRTGELMLPATVYLYVTGVTG